MSETSGTTVGIKTFLRTSKLRMCLESLTNHAWHSVIVADDGPIDAKRERMYAELAERLPLQLLRLEFDTGLGAGRNEIVRQCQTDHLLMLDDDQTVPGNIGDLSEVLDEASEIGGVSCIWIERDGLKCTACDISIDGSRLIKECRADHEIRRTTAGQRYVVFDFIPNSTMFRTACLRDQAWDPIYKIGKEHLDFYLSHKKLGKWRFAVSMDVRIGHHPEGSSKKYARFRGGKRVKVSEKYFLDKFGVTEVIEGRKFIDPQHRGKG